MTKHHLHLPTLASGFVVLANLVASPAQAELPSLGSDGVTRIIVEAEDLEGVDWKRFGAGSTGWRVGRHGFDLYQNNTFGGHWQSRTRTAMTDAGGNRARLRARVVIPKAGKYKLWVKYECPPLFNYAFDVRLSKGMKTLFDKTFGLIESPKHFSFTKTLTTGSLYWAWGLDHDAAEGYVVELPEGKLTLTLSKVRSPEPAGARSIDAIMLTDDLSEISSPRFPRYPLLDELRRGNHLFLRYRLSPDAPEAARLTWNRWGKRYNDFYCVSGEHMKLVRAYDAQGNLLVGEDGKPVPTPNGQLTGLLQPGETSAWLDIGPGLNVESTATLICKAELLGPNGRPAKEQPRSIPFSIDIASQPSERHIVKSFELTPEENIRTLVVLLQPDPDTPVGLEWSMKLADVYRRVTRELDAIPRQAPFPKKMRFYAGTGWPVYPQQPHDTLNWEVGMQFRRALGLNTVVGNTFSGEEVRRQQKWLREKGFQPIPSMFYQHSQDPDKTAKLVQENDSAEEFYYLSYGDEIGLPHVDVSKPEIVAAFHAYLKRHGMKPQDLGLSDWDKVKPLNSFSADVAVKIGVIPEGQQAEAVDRTLRRLYWHSSQFRIEQGIADFAAKTRRLRELLGHQVQTSANLGGMHPFYWVHQSSFIEAFKHDAMTLAWSEDYDYCQPETSRLAVEFLAGYLKAGTKYHGQRMQFYCMPHFPGQSPEHLVQNAVLLWGQNVKDLDWFSTPPDGYTTENYVNPRGGMPTFRMMREINEMAGVVEDWLEPAQPVPAQVALLLSEASDIWEVRGKGQWDVKPGSESTNAFQEERKNTYNVLRNAGYRVDLVTEADVQDGHLDPYRALYLGGENLERATAGRIADWVKAGGVLYASGGAARKDEYDEPLDALDAVLGRGKQISYQRYKGPLRSKLELLFLEALDRVTLADGTAFDALATMERFAAAGGADILATYANGSPAVVKAQTGKGTGTYIGTMPGEAWAKKALPVVPCGKGGPESNSSQFEPTDFDPVAASVILRPLLESGIQPEVRVDKPYIVCNRLASGLGTVITIVNLGQTQKGSTQDVTLDIDGLAEPGKVWSYAFRSGLEHQFEAGTLSVRLPSLGLVDIVVVQSKRVVFMGDSITDGHTYPQLVGEALTGTGRKVPTLINAAIAGDTAKGMRSRVARDVLVHKPTLVTLSVGINDVLRGVKAADYEADVRAIVGQLKAERIPMLFLTTSVLGPKHAEADKKLAEYNAILHGIAKENGYAMAEVNEGMQKARREGVNVLEGDEVHPNWPGHRVMARAVLDALGHKDVPLPEKLKLEVLPGVIRKWRVQLVSDGTPLDEKTVLALKSDSTWKEYTLPEKEPQEHWWSEDERRRGFALSLQTLIGKAKSYRAIATMDETRAREVYFNTGSQLQTVWLNGKRIYKSEGWTGWHAGKERIPALLKPGRNTIVIETSGQFFLSVTEDNTW